MTTPLALANLNAMALMAAQACGSAEDNNGEATIDSVSNLTFDIETISKVVGKSAICPENLEYEVDIQDGNNIFGYVSTGGSGGECLVFQATMQAYNGSPSPKDAVKSSFIINEVHPNALVSTGKFLGLDTRTFTLVLDRIITHGLRKKKWGDTLIENFSIISQRLHVPHLRILQAINGNMSEKIQLRLDLCSTATSSVSHEAMVTSTLVAVTSSMSDLVIWDGTVVLSGRALCKSIIEPSLRPRCIEWVCQDAPDKVSTMSSNQCQLLLHISHIESAAEDSKDPMAEIASLLSKSGTAIKHIRVIAAGSLAVSIPNMDEVSEAFVISLLLPEEEKLGLRWCQEYISTVLASRDIDNAVFITFGLCAVTGHELSQVSVDTLGIQRLIANLSGCRNRSGKTVKIEQVDADARSSIEENSQLLHALVGQLLHCPEESKFRVAEATPAANVIALRSRRPFRPFWVECGRILDAAETEDVLSAPFLVMREAKQSSQLQTLLNSTCQDAINTIVRPEAFRECSKKLDFLARQSLFAATNSLTSTEAETLPNHLRQLCVRYTQRHQLFDAAVRSDFDQMSYQAEVDDLLTKCPPLAPSLSLLSNVLGRHREVFVGRLTPLQVLFAKKHGSKAKSQAVTGGAADVYDEGVFARVHKRVVEAVVLHLCGMASSKGRALRVLEVGAGTGGTTLPVIKLLSTQHSGLCAEYVFTDLGSHFVNAFGRKYQEEYDFLRVASLDISKDPRRQGFASAEYDIVICVNVLHATSDLYTTLSNVELLLAPGGILLLQEITTQSSAFLDATFGLTEGWWSVSPSDPLRRDGYPTLYPTEWHQALCQVGFEWSISTPTTSELALDQQAVFVAQKSFLAHPSRSIQPMVRRHHIIRSAHSRDGNTYLLVGSGATAVRVAKELVQGPGVCRLLWLRPSRNLSTRHGAPVPLVDDDGREMQVVMELAQGCEVRVSTFETDLENLQILHLLAQFGVPTSNLTGVVWASDQEQYHDPSSLFELIRGLHVALDSLNTPPQALIILHGVDHAFEKEDYLSKYSVLQSFISFVHFRTLPAVLAFCPQETEDGPSANLTRSILAPALRFCAIPSGRIPLLDFSRCLDEKNRCSRHYVASAKMSKKSSHDHFTSADKHPAVRSLECASHRLPSLSQILQTVVAEAEALLNSSSSLRADDPLMMAGIDSLAVVELRENLMRIYPKIVLPSTYIYEFPTSEAIAEQLHILLKGLDDETHYSKVDQQPIAMIDIDLTESAHGVPNMSNSSLTSYCPTPVSLTSPSTGRAPVDSTSPKSQEAGSFSAAHALANTPQDHQIAVIAMQCRMPGGMNSSEQFWDGLKLGRDAMTDIPLSRFDVDAVYDGDLSSLPRGKTYVRRGGFLTMAEYFDTSRFHIPEAQLEQMDPQQRILLEVVDDALKHAGYSRRDVMGKDVSVYIGVSSKDWAKVAPQEGAYLGTGIAGSIVSNRISFELGLKGTSMSIDTACSSSLVAVDLAVQALRLGKTDLAIAGGINMNLHPDPYIVLCQSKMLSPEGFCKTFDEDADGYVRSEGCGVVLLKRVSDALRDNNQILGVITGSYSNQDGRSTNISAPSGKAQQELLRRGLADARRRPEDIDFLELHGTGTALGDPVEIHSLKAVFGTSSGTSAKSKLDQTQESRHTRQRPLWLGAVKTNIGHLEPAAGVAGLIKSLWVVNQRQVPPNIHLQKVNPGIDFDGFEMARLPQRLEYLKKGPGEKILAGCSSFGFGGTNAFILVESPPPHQPRDITRTKMIPEEDKAAIASSCQILNVNTATQKNGRTKKTDEKLVIAFTGQGSQFAGMAQPLYGKDQDFTSGIDECLDLVPSWISSDELRRALLKPSVAIEPAVLSQPSLFIMQYALFRSLAAKGLMADIVLGHSIGEIAASVVSGCLTVAQGLELVCHRAVAMEEPSISGSMYAVMLPHLAVQQIIDELGLNPSLSVAAVNGYNLTTVAGSKASMSRLLEKLGPGCTSTSLGVNKPFHSPLMASCMPKFKSSIQTIRSCAPSTSSPRFWSTATGSELKQAPDAKHWESHALQPVLFEPTIRSVSNEFSGNIRILEVGPKLVLANIVNRWLRLPENAPAPCVLAGCSSVASKAFVDTVTLQKALDASKVHILDPNKYLVPLIQKQSADYLDLGTLQRDVLLPTSDIVLVSSMTRLDRGRQGFIPWRRGYHAFMTEPKVSKIDADTLAVTFLANHRVKSIVGDHVVRGRPIMPGAGIFDMALGAIQVIENLHPLEALPICLRNAEIIRPIVLASDMEPPWLRVTYNSGTGNVKVQSAAGDTNGSDIPDTVHFIDHACGTVARPSEIATDQARRVGVDVAKIKSRCTRDVDIPGIRAQLAARGLRYGPQFQLLTDARAGEGECLGTLQLPSSGSSGYLVHPGLFDSAMQSCSVTVGQMTGKDAFAVGSVGCLHIRAFLGEHRKDANIQVWSRITSPPEDKSRYEANVDVFDDDGNVLFSIEKLTLVKISSLASSAAANERRCLYVTEWTPLQPSIEHSLTLSLGVHEAQNGCTAIDLDHHLGLVRALRPRVSRSPIGRLHSSLSDLLGAKQVLGVDLPLINTLFLAEDRPLQTLVFACDPNDTSVNTASNLASLFKSLHVAQSSDGLISELRTVVVATFGCQLVTGEECTGLSSSSTWGLVRTARLEFPQFRIVTLDVDPVQSSFVHSLSVLDAVLDTSEDEIVWRNGRRYVPRLTDLGLDVESDTHATFDVLRPTLDLRLSEILPPGVKLNTMVPVGVGDAELHRIRNGYALVNSIALDSLVYGARAVPETEVVPAQRQLWNRYAKAKCDRDNCAVDMLLPPLGCDDDELAEWMDEAIDLHPEVAPELNMLRHLYRKHEAVFCGAKDPLELLFRTSQHTETAGVYSESFYARYYNTVVTHVFSSFVEKWRLHQREACGASDSSSRPLRILEVGAGSGSTSRRLLQAAAELGIAVEYHFTDVSETFLRKASTDKTLTAPKARVSFGLFNAEQDPRFQGIGSSTFDVVVAVNVIHATTNLTETMAHVRQLLKPQGIVILSEIVQESPISDATFAMTEGWWRFEDKDLRPDYPLMAPANWERLLLATGFDAVRTLDNGKAGTAQAIIVAQASSLSQLGEIDGPLGTTEEPVAGCGVYVITGGTGGLGLLAAVVLLEQDHASKVYLLSRTCTVSPNSAHVWERLEAVAQPHQVVKVKCDVSSGMQVAGVFESIHEKGEYVKGIVHSAGTLRDAMLQNQTRGTMTPVFGAKVEAVRHLHDCSLDEPQLQHFVIFSSASGLLGSPGQSNHSAANTVLDAFAMSRRAQGLPALSLQWGTVEGLGEAARKGANKLALKFGHGQVSETAAEAVLKAVFASDWRYMPTYPVAVTPFDWNTFVRSRTKVPHITQAFASMVKRSGSGLVLANGTTATAAAESHNQLSHPLPVERRADTSNKLPTLIDIIQSCVEATINKRMPDDSITFYDAGIDSLSAIEFRNRLQSQLGPKVKLGASLVFDYPTLEKLLEFLQSSQDLVDDVSKECKLSPESRSEILPKAHSEPFPLKPVMYSDQKGAEPKPPRYPASSTCQPCVTVVRSLEQSQQLGVDRAVSIVGMDCRLPGGGSIDELWDSLMTSKDPFQDIPFSRWDLDVDFYCPPSEKSSKAKRSIVKQGAFLAPDQVEWFDNDFFHISHAEARSMDPNQRVLLEVTYQALADAGFTRKSLSGKNIGLFVGFMNYDAFFLANKNVTGAFTASSASPAVLSNRISHVLGLEGPSCTIDTACSSSLYALHMAIGALRSNQCEAAVVAGVNLMMSPAAYVAECAAGMLSPTERCHSLSASADGFARGEGCAALVIQRRGDATAQSRYIYANVLGSSVGHDGTTANLTSPNGPAQARTIRRALDDARASPDSITFVEGHLTGTVLGDPIEFSALREVFGGKAQQGRSSPLHLGAIKSNLGHLEGVAGISGLIKAVLALSHKQLPPIAHLTELNPHLNMDDFMVNIPRSSSVQLKPGSPVSSLRAGVSSFGFSGANAHTIIEAASVAEHGVSHRVMATRKHAFSRNYFPLQRPGSRHALLGSLDSTPLQEDSIKVPIGYRIFSLLNQHLVKKVPTVPGAMLVELASAVAVFTAKLNVHSSSTAVIDQIFFAAPLIVGAPKSRAITIAYDSMGHFTISSELLDGHTEDKASDEVDGVAAAYGKFSKSNEMLEVKNRSGKLLQYQELCSNAVDIKALWTLLESVGISYSGHFCSLHRASTSTSTGSRNAKAVGYISIAENGEDGYISHPAILDSAMQVCAALVLSSLENKAAGRTGGPARTFLPASMEGIRSWRPKPREARRREFSTLVELLSLEEAEITTKLCVLDEGGDCVFDIAKIVFRPLPSARPSVSTAERQNLSETMAPPAHTLVWAQSPYGPGLSSNPQTCHFLVDEEHVRAWKKWGVGINPEPSAHMIRSLNTGSSFSPATVYYVPSMNATPVELCTSVLELVKGLASQNIDRCSPCSLWIFTLTCQMAPFTSPQHASIWGLVRSLALEDTRGVNIGLIDLADSHVKSLPSVLCMLVGRLSTPTRATAEWAYNAGKDIWYLPRLVTDHISELDAPTMAAAPQGFESLAIVPDCGFDSSLAQELDDQSVLVRVCAVGINFHDVVFAVSGATGADDGSALGVDFSGVVEAVGSHVNHLKPGDKVFGMADGCMRTMVCCNARLVYRLDPNWDLSFEQAAALPTVFVTAYYILVHLADLQAGQRVLVHTATGGLGHMLVQIAQSLGAKVIATAGSDEKRDYLVAELGIDLDNVSTSRDVHAFSTRFAHLTGQVDVVVNTLSGEYISETLRLLRHGGRFMEAGKLSIWTTEQMASARPDVAYSVIKLTDANLLDSFLKKLQENLASRAIKPPRVQSFSYLTQLKQAFEHIRKAQHLGKVVVAMDSKQPSVLNTLSLEANIAKDFVIPDVPLSLDQERYHQGISKVVEFAENELRSAARSLEIHQVDPRWRKLFDAYSEHAKSETDADSTLTIESIVTAWPEAAPEARLVELIHGKAVQLFRGTIEAPALLFSPKAMEVTEAFYSQSLALTYYNTVLAKTLAQIIEQRPIGNRRLRILEVGAGTGATTSKLLPVLISSGRDIEYVFTDVTDIFLKRARKAHASNSALKYSKVRLDYSLLDIELDPAMQGFQPCSYDIVLAANCIHATRIMAETTAHIRSLLRPRGILLLFESTRKSAITDCTFGYTDGWWRFEDVDLRPDYPLLSFEKWKGILSETAGFADVQRADQLAGKLESSAIIVARNEGYGIQDEQLAHRHPVVRKDATYLVTGGNSGLGLVAARVLLDAGAENVVLLSRSSKVTNIDGHLFDEAKHLASANGSRLKSLPCDVANPDEIDGVVALLTSENFPPVRGIIHAAGVLSNAPFRQQAASSLEKVMSPKIRGASNLVTKLSDKSTDKHLDFMLLFSSTAALVGSVEQANHGAANATLDAMASQWRRDGLHVISLAWGIAIGLGTLARTPPSKTLTERLGVISPNLAYRAIRAAISVAASPTSHIGPYRIIAPIQWHKLLRSMGQGGSSFPVEGGQRSIFAAYHRQLTLRRQLRQEENNPARHSRPRAIKPSSELRNPNGSKSVSQNSPWTLDSIETTIRAILSDVAAVHIPQGSSDARLDDFGIDSLSSMELGIRLNTTFLGLDLSPTAIHGFPTLSTLSQHVHEQLLQTAGLASVASGSSTVRLKDSQTKQKLVDLNEVFDDGKSSTPIGIVIHGAAGEVHHAKAMAQKLPFKLIGIRQTDDTPSTSISQMAAHYMALLDEAGILGSTENPRLRIQLMGYSFGGCVAWEMARMLELDGSCKPERLILLDGGPGSDVSLQATLGVDVNMEEGIGPLGMRLMGALLFASGAKVIDRAELIDTLEGLGLTGSKSSNSGQLPDIEKIKRATADIVARIPESLRGEPLRKMTNLFVANASSYDRYLAFHRAGKAPAFDGPVFIARSRLPRDDNERSRAQLWLDSDHYAFLGRQELAEAIRAMVEAPH